MEILRPDDKKDTESSDEKKDKIPAMRMLPISLVLDNGNADTKDSDTSGFWKFDKSNNPNGSSSSDTEDTLRHRADLPSAFGALIGQMADTPSAA